MTSFQKRHFMLFLFMFAFGLSFSSIRLDASIAWETDYVSALEKSRNESKPLLLFFTGSDWSGLSMKMKNEILDSDSFQSPISSSFICVEIDFPQHKGLSSQKQDQNLHLKNQFHVEDYPALVLIDSNEREILRLGYVSESGSQLAEDLVRVIEQDKQLIQGLAHLNPNPLQLKRLYQTAQELRRQEAIENILAAGVLTEDPFFLLEKYRLLVEKGEMDSSEASSIRGKLTNQEDYQIHFTIALVEFQELAKRATGMEGRNRVIKPLEDYLSRFGETDQENVWRIEMMIAQFYLEADEWRSALKHAETAYEAAPLQMREEIKHSLKYIKEQVGQIAEN